MAGTTVTIDEYVALRVRSRRRELGISQTELAQSLGLSFQQVQKYETGRDRISAARLYEIAGCLDVPLDYFFSGMRKRALRPRGRSRA